MGSSRVVLCGFGVSRALLFHGLFFIWVFGVRRAVGICILLFFWDFRGVFFGVVSQSHTCIGLTSIILVSAV